MQWYRMYSVTHTQELLQMTTKKPDTCTLSSKVGICTRVQSGTCRKTDMWQSDIRSTMVYQWSEGDMPVVSVHPTAYCDPGLIQPYGLLRPV